MCVCLCSCVFRRMFPVVSVSVSGLRPEAMYTVYLDMILVDNHRWKYVRGEWMVGGKADPPHPTIYKHHDSPHYGSHWMKSPIVFNKVKLTNKPGDGGHVSQTLSMYFEVHLQQRICWNFTWVSLVKWDVLQFSLEGY